MKIRNHNCKLLSKTISTIKVIHTFLLVILCLPFIGIFAQSTKPDSLIQVLHLVAKPSEKVRLLNNLAGIYVADNPVQSKMYADQALFIAESINDLNGKATACYYLAQHAYYLQDFDRSSSLLTLSKSGFEKLKDDYWVAKTDVSLGLLFQHKLEYEKAFILLYKALDIFRRDKKEKEMAETYIAIGNNFFQQGDREKAFEYYSSGMSVFEKIRDETGMGQVYNYMGEIYRQKGNFQEAQRYLTMACSLNPKEGNPANHITSLVYLGKLFIDLESYDSSKFYLEMAESLSNKAGLPTKLPAIKIAMGKLSMSVSDYKQAMEHLMEGYELAVQQAKMVYTRSAALGLSELHSIQNNYEAAYKYHIVYKQVSDSISSIRNTEKITQIEMQHLFDQQQKFDLMRQQKLRRNFGLIGVSVFFLLVMASLLFGRLRIAIKHNKSIAENLQLEQLKLREEIEQKNRVLATNVMYLIRKNELINYITDRLSKFMNNFTDVNKEKVRAIIVNLQSSVDKNVWELFTERFSDVHKNFYKNLMLKFPNLTENERRLCALLRLNLTSKEISAITHQNVNTIEVARTRLRKKLNLSNTEINLSNYLSNL